VQCHLHTRHTAHGTTPNLKKSQRAVFVGYNDSSFVFFLDLNLNLVSSPRPHDLTSRVHDLTSSEGMFSEAEGSFCKACSGAPGGACDGGGDTCWAITPIDDQHRAIGCNNGGWTGHGIYYAGCGYSGGFSGAKENGQGKAGFPSIGVRIYAHAVESAEPCSK
jgi:hypothetical protein